MNLQQLFVMQKELDAFIQQNRSTTEPVFREKGLALLVELAELANETRSFKFWSAKGPSERSVILEEYVDSIHFLLSLGIECELADYEQWPQADISGSLTELFIETNSVILQFLKEQTRENYERVWQYYGAIAQRLGFTPKELMTAYIAKNEENYERQKSGY